MIILDYIALEFLAKSESSVCNLTAAGKSAVHFHDVCTGRWLVLFLHIATSERAMTGLFLFLPKALNVWKVNGMRVVIVIVIH